VSAEEPVVYRQSRFRVSPGACQLVIVRHGESMPATRGVPFEREGGHGNPPLAPEGHEQAERVGERLAAEQVDAIYVTSLRRTHETAAPLARRLGITPHVEPDLREVFLGEWEGELLRQKVADGDPLVAEMFRQQRWDVIPGAESHDQLEGRVRPALERIAARHPDERVVVVVHGGIIGCIMAMASGSAPFAFLGADNASISHVVISAERWTVRGYNDVTHLTD